MHKKQLITNNNIAINMEFIFRTKEDAIIFDIMLALGFQQQIKA